MPLWKLTPTDLDAPNWRNSSHRGLAIVRAPNEAAAREVAAGAFNLPTHFRPGGGPQFPPWTSSELVRTERIEDARYDAEGPAMLLYPSL
jgi:hypothetical protein